MSTRILYVVSSLDPFGAERQLALLATHLPRDEFDVHVCCLDPAGSRDGTLARADVPVTVIGQRWNIDPLAAWRLERLVAELRPDVVHTGSFHSGVYGRLAAGKARLVTTEPAAARQPSWHRRTLGRWLSATVQAVVVPRADVKDYSVRQGSPPEKLVVIPAAAPAVAVGRQFSRSALLTELGLPSDARLIGIAGRLEIEEGWKEVIWTLDILRCIRDDLHLLVLGDGRQRGQLERFVRLCTMSPNIHFLRRRFELVELLPHLSQMWHGEGSGIPPLGLMQALAAGVPAVATDAPANRELVIHDQTGFLVPPGDRAGRARCANRLLNDAGLRARLSDAARHRVAAQFNIALLVARHVELYRHICR